MFKMEDVRRVETFSESYGVLSELMPDFVDELSKARKNALVHFNDYEPLSFCVLSDYHRKEQIVLVSDSITGDVIGRFDSLEEFRDTVLEEIDEDIDDEDMD